jgi:hypothetical protein
MGLGQKFLWMLKIREVRGLEVPQLYSSAPSSSRNEFCAVVKTTVLKPGEKESVTLSVGVGCLAHWDKGLGQWVSEPSVYALFVGRHTGDEEALEHELMLGATLV